MYDDDNGRTTVWFLLISWLKNHWEEEKILKKIVSRNVFKKGDFCQFLASKNYDKIWHCFNICCNFGVSENFDMSPVFATQQHIHWRHVKIF